MMKDSFPNSLDSEFKALDELYRQGARELPPPHLDAQIMAFAVANGAPRTPIASQKPRRQFPYVISTAASALLLVGIFMLNPDLVKLPVESGDSALLSPASLPETQSKGIAPSNAPAMPQARMQASPTLQSATSPEQAMASTQPAMASAQPSVQGGQPKLAKAVTPENTDVKAAQHALAEPDESTAVQSELAKTSVAAPDMQITTDGVETELQSLEAALVRSDELQGDRAEFKVLIEQFESQDYPLTDEQQARLNRLRQQVK